MREWLIEARERIGMSQMAVSKVIGVKQPTYCQYESGQRTPKPKTAKRIADLLGVPWTRFYERDD